MALAKSDPNPDVVATAVRFVRLVVVVVVVVQSGCHDLAQPCHETIGSLSHGILDILRNAFRQTAPHDI
eukprot:scaffold9459_cov45-Attheya_sp.AAC.4